MPIYGNVLVMYITRKCFDCYSTGERCRRFLDLTPEDTHGKKILRINIYLSEKLDIDLYRYVCMNPLTFLSVEGVLWLSMVSEFIYIGLLGTGFLLMWLEVLCMNKEMHALKINAFAALCTVLSGTR